MKFFKFLPCSDTLLTSLFLFLSPLTKFHTPSTTQPFSSDLHDTNFSRNKFYFSPTSDKLNLFVFSRTWPIGANPGGMERYITKLYHSLVDKGHEIHLFTTSIMATFTFTSAPTTTDPSISP
ncbi:unnamed protein product [Linum tenue]|uniref:Glycosyltransferase subfamily 4-like N-terminal domain-containing protein n=1 Tax=Linum tenue TaxID=586396 RepID=A0AAV0RUZ4_9ROSI|nr:unnamed protein product [Linum tenue]